jgi:hypothetical protein
MQVQSSHERSPAVNRPVLIANGISKKLDKKGQAPRRNLEKLRGLLVLVPKKGLEPPHPCGYMDLNHARLPIPPLRRGAATERRREDYTGDYFTGPNRRHANRSVVWFKSKMG